MMLGKILLVANSDWYLYNFRLSFARFLKSQGFEVVMVAPGGEFVQEIASAGFRFIEWNVGRRSISPVFELKEIFKLIKIYASEKPTLVHHFTVKPVLYGSLAARIAKVKSVVNSITGLGYIFLKAGWKGDLMRSIVIPFYRFALSYPYQRIIFENESDMATFVKRRLVKGGEGFIIRGVGVNTDYFRPAHEPICDEPIIVFPSRMLFDKGLGTVIESARILKRKTKARFFLVGDTDPGNPTSANEQMIKGWEKEGIVEWYGFQKDMPSIYQNCNIVTFPSLGEGLPTVLIEASACERAIVTTDVPGCRDVVANGVNGLIVPPNQPEALAQAIETLINDPEKRSQMGVEGRKIVMEKFTVDYVNQQTYSVYRQILKKKA